MIIFIKKKIKIKEKNPIKVPNNASEKKRYLKNRIAIKIKQEKKIEKIPILKYLIITIEKGSAA